MVQILITVLLAVPLKSVNASETIYFSEIAWAGSSLSTADEWLELVNPTGFDADVSGWKISGAGSNETDLVLPYPTVIPANGALLVANYDSSNQNAASTVAPGVVSSTVSLSNSKMLIRLFDANGVLVDQAGDGSAPFAGYSAEIKATMIRNQTDILGDVAEAWRTCDLPHNISTDDCGTPGFIDEVFVQDALDVPTEESIDVVDDNISAVDEISDIEGTPVADVNDSETETMETVVSFEDDVDNNEAVLSDLDLTSNTIADNIYATTSEDVINQVSENDDDAESVLDPIIQTTTTVTAETATTTVTTTTISAMMPMTTESITPTDITALQTDLSENTIDPQTNLNNAKMYLRINEVMAAPVLGKEWIELISLNQNVTIHLEGLAIHDAVGRVVNLTGSVGGGVNYKVVEIPSSRLNNSGDSVHIVSADGILIDAMDYQSHEKGVLLAKDQDMKWQFTQIATPGEANAIWMPKTEEEIHTLDTLEDQDVVEQGQTVSTTTESADEKASLINHNNINAQLLIKLNEIQPNPAEGKEWVELVSFATTSVDLAGLELHDGAGRIMKLKGMVEAGVVHVIELSSARFNNGGDKILLVDHKGVVIDELEYTGSQKGFSYARMPNGAWKEVPLPTKGLRNYEVGEEGADDKAMTGVISSTSTASITSKSQSVTKTKTSTKATTKTSTAKTTTAIQKLLSLTDYSMLHQEEFGGMRLQLRGTVGTLPRHVSGRGFILLNHDGRGLLVRVPSYKKIPAYGTFITVTGSLKFDTRELPYLSLTKNDDWKQEMMNAVTPSIREVSLLSPASEDAWSLVQATGTVSGVSGNTVNLIVDNIDVDMTIKSGVEYRASRLKKGDVVNIKGILDISNDRPVILPRHADEIVLISHAEESLTATGGQKQGIPGWTPFGAAAVAVGAVEGLKKFKQRLKHQTLKQIVIKQKTLETN